MPPTPFLEAGQIGDTAVLVAQRMPAGPVRVAAFKVPPTQGDPPGPGEAERWAWRRRPVSVFEAARPYEQWTPVDPPSWVEEGSTFFGFGAMPGVAPADFKKSRIDALLSSAPIAGTKPQLFMTDWSPDGRWCCSVLMSGGRAVGQGDLVLGASTQAGGDMYVALADAHAEKSLQVWRLAPPYEWYVPGLAGWSEDSRLFALFADNGGRTVVWVLPVPDSLLEDGKGDQ